eukprot:7302895-Pyramimonas_sp.AAC.1
MQQPDGWRAHHGCSVALALAPCAFVILERAAGSRMEGTSRSKCDSRSSAAHVRFQSPPR